jgi:hypothetical protein
MEFIKFGNNNKTGEEIEGCSLFTEKVMRLLCRKRRIWKKKINYDCRKKVADNRLRIKGKFVTR